jgi:hypothetical protein
MEALVTEKQKRRLQGSQNKKQEITPEVPAMSDHVREGISPAKKSKSDLAYLVKSIKGKTESMKNKKQMFPSYKK